MLFIKGVTQLGSIQYVEQKKVAEEYLVQAVAREETIPRISPICVLMCPLTFKIDYP